MERRKKVAARKELVRKAMRGLPLQKGAEARISGLLPVLESTFYAVKQKNTPATKGRVEEELRKLVRQSDNLADHLAGMDREAIAIWAYGGGVSYNDAVRRALEVSLILMTSSDWAESGLEATKRASKGKRGPDKIASALRDAAAYVYTELTGRRAGRVYDAGAGKEKDSPFTGFLNSVYAAYGIPSSARSRTRKR